ncbi:hypothetical protein [Streptomyces sp. PsTaAH-124]|uniref:hypothetical protein n=1 Tax=Streptomyces sp. PsTaAH-124 TaxID=1157638 RepID=UPI00037A1068|nr:hypothetical protein [Streptomyces sp. PsTaAH-124]
MTTLAQILGSEIEAARWMASRARGLVLWNRVAPQDAYRLVEAAVAEHDPAILAELGQVWTLRPEAAESRLPPVLYLTHWLDRDHLVVEDGSTGQAVIRLLTLHAYQLDYWRRQDRL